MRKRGTIVRLIYLTWAAAWWVLTGFSRSVRGRVVVLCYHGVTPRQRRSFERQMRLIADRATDVSLLTSTQSGNQNRPRVCITFDDGFSNLLDTALPIMHELHIPSIVFAVTGNLGDKPRWEMPVGHPEAEELVMTAEQVRAAAGCGLCRFGSHTVSHPDLTTISKDQLIKELVDSKASLEHLLGVEVEDLALPFGDYDERVIAVCKASGYKRVYTLNPCLVSPQDGVTKIGRFSMSPDVWGIEFLLTCAGAYSWLGPWRRFLRRIRAMTLSLTGRSWILSKLSL